jgi:TP901 family phage tail tape measure protein
MADELNKDVVGARINLDTSKMQSAFKVIDDGVKQNAQSFKTLNAELALTEKSYMTMAAAADKIALTADERRKKIMAESDALVKQRTAQADLLTAKKIQLDTTNQVIDAKLQAQKAIVKKHEDAIEQQEQQHLEKMAILSQKTINTEAQENLLSAQYDRQLQLMKNSDEKMEMEAERHQLRMAQLARNDEKLELNQSGNSIGSRFLNESGRYAVGTLAGVTTFAILDQLSNIPQIVGDVSASMTKLKQVLEIAPAYEHSPQKLADDLKQLQQVAGVMSQAYGVDFSVVLDTMSQAGRKFKDVSDIVIATDSALQLTAVDSVNASKSIGAMEAIMSQFGLTTTQARQALFEITAAAHEFQTTGSDLTDAIMRSGASFATMKMNTAESIAAIATLSQMTAQDGSTIGNAWKSIENSLGSEKAAKALKQLGIEVYDANGNLKDSVKILQDIQAVWPKLSDAAKQHYATVISGGKYQYGRLEAFLNDYGNTYQKALDAIKKANEQQQQELVKSAMESIPKQFDATKASFQVMANTMATQVTPALIALLVEIRKMDDGIINNISSIDKMIKIGLTLAEAYAVWKVGALAYSGAVKVVSNAVENFNERLEIADANSAGTIGAFENMGKAALGMAGAVAQSVAKMALLYATTVAINSLIERINNPEQFKIDDLQNRLHDLQNLKQAGTGTWDQIKQGVSNGLNLYGDATKNLFTLHFGAAWQDIKNGVTVDPMKDQNAIQEQIQTIQKQLDDAKEKKSAEDQAEMDKALKQEEDLLKKYTDAAGKIAPPGGSGDSNTDTSFNNFLNGGSFKLPLDAIDNQAQQAQQIVDSSSNAISLFNAKLAATGDTADTTAQKIALFNDQQAKLHQANDMLRTAVSELNGKQALLNDLVSKGVITSDEYNSSSQEVQSRIKSLTNEINQNSVAWFNDAASIKAAQQQELQNSFDFSEKWISHQKAIGQLNEQQEYEADLRVQARYKEGTDLRMQADEKVYAAKQAYMQSEQQALDDLMTKEKAYLEQSKQAELDKIDQAKQAYVDAQDTKIKALDDLMQAEDQANSDQDYATQLKSKQDRLAVLQSAVGPDGIKERKQVIKDIADMEQKHQQDLTKRAQEAEKQRLEDDKAAKEKEFDQQKADVENHYKDLLSVFDNFKNDEAGRAEALKNIQIQKEQEKNNTILSNLDTFIAQYKSKMSVISGLSQSQEQIDLNTYNTNKDLYDQAKARGDTATMAQLQAANNAIRSKYGITEDTGKLQHFADGGIVQGIRSQPVPVVAHAGEMFLNEGQQSNLFKLLNFAIPKINFSMPSFSMASGSNQSVVNHNYYTVSTGDVNLTDNADIRTFWSERDGMVRRIQTRTGAKEQ